MPNDGDKILVICLVLLQDKSELNTMVNVDYCKLLAHIFPNRDFLESGFPSRSRD